MHLNATPRPAHHEHGVTDGRVLADDGAVDGLAERGRVVVDVRHVHVHRRHRAQGWSPSVLCLHH